MKAVSQVWSIEVWSRSLGLPALPLLLPLLEEADVVGCRMQVVNQPTLPKSALCAGETNTVS